MKELRIRNWRKFQHYKNRRPDWIKLHAMLLDDLAFRDLPDASKAHLCAIWLLAARLHDASNEEATVPARPDHLSAMTGCSITDDSLQTLVNAGFIVDASNVLAERKHDASPEKERELDGELEEDIANAPSSTGFDRFWEAYPKRVGKRAAKKAWRAVSSERPPVEQIVAKIEALARTKQWTEAGGQYIPHPSTWLRRGGWDDELNDTRHNPAPATAPREPETVFCGDCSKRIPVAEYVDHVASDCGTRVWDCR